MFDRTSSLINTIFVIIMARYFSHVDTAEVDVGVARAIPLINTAISGSASLQLTTNSKIKCLSECSQRNCSSFNFGNGECHLHNTYFCEGVLSLVSMSGFKYYDVEVGTMIPYADTYRHLTDCQTLGRCSPKCYTGTTTTTTTPAPTTTTSTTTTTSATTTTTTTTPAPTTTTTTTPAPTTTTTTTPAPTTTTTTTPAPTTTTTTTPAPTTTTTTTPAPTTTTTTTPAPTTTTTTTPAPTTTTTTTPVPTTTTSTTPAPTTTTTTPAPTTTTTTSTTTTTPTPTTTTTTTPEPTTTTTSAPAFTTLPPPGPGDINWACTDDNDCPKANSDCRNNAICECVAGYSYNPTTRSCVTTCPGTGFDNSFTRTSGFYVSSNDASVVPSVFDIANCESLCAVDSSCASYEYDYMTYNCHLSYVTKYGNDGIWYPDIWFEYYQRNCL